MTKLASKYLSQILIFISWFFLYLLNVNGSLFGGDSGEFSRVLVNWEIAHPPGYPLYTVLNNIWALFFTNKQYSLSLFNAILALFVGLILYQTFIRLNISITIATLSSIFFMSNYLFWFYSLIPEVFTLSILFIAIEYLLITKILNTKIKPKLLDKYVLLFLITLGLSFAHHHMFAFFLPGYIYVFKENKGLQKNIWNNKFIYTIILAVTSLVYYLYIPLVTKITGYVGMTDTRTLSGLIDMITRAPYGTFKAYSGSSGNFANMFFDIAGVGLYLVKDFRLLGIIFLILGLFYISKINNSKNPKVQNKSLQIFFGMIFVNSISLLFFYFYSNFYLSSEFGVSTFERFVLFFYINIIYLLAVGAQWIRTKQEVLGIGLLTILVGSVLVSNYAGIRELKNVNEFYNMASDLLNTPDKGSILMLSTDNTAFLSSAVWKNNKVRPDIQFFSLGYLKSDTYREIYKNKLYIPPDKEDAQLIEKFYQENYRRGRNIFMDRAGGQGFWAPYGLLWKYYPTKTAVIDDEKNIIAKNIELWNIYNIPNLNKYKLMVPFIQDIKTVYARGMWGFISYLHVSKNNDLALQYSEKYIDAFFYEYFFRNFYVDLKITLSSCDSKLDTIINKMIIEENQNLREFKDYMIVANYYKNCKNDTKNHDKYMKEYQRLKKYDTVPLQEL